MSQNNFSLTEGHFFISVNGNRLKQYAGNTVYLDNNSEFSLEVFNPTSSKVLAKIKINGNYISTSGLVLKPGQRVFLERYFDIAKKFKFETYTVDDSPETAGAIANNGLIEVEFFKESIPVIQTTSCYTIPTYWYDYPRWTTGGVYYSQDNICSAINPDSGLGNGYTNMSATAQNFFNHVGETLRDTTSETLRSSDLKGASLDSLSFMDMSTKKTVETKETGRIEAGSNSNQSFSLDYTTYNSWYSNKVSWKILPASQRPIEISDLKVFCTSCRMKKKKSSWTFCPSCGNKFE